MIFQANGSVLERPEVVSRPWICFRCDQELRLSSRVLKHWTIPISVRERNWIYFPFYIWLQNQTTRVYNRKEREWGKNLKTKLKKKRTFYLFLGFLYTITEKVKSDIKSFLVLFLQDVNKYTQTIIYQYKHIYKRYCF